MFINYKIVLDVYYNKVFIVLEEIKVLINIQLQNKLKCSELFIVLELIKVIKFTDRYLIMFLDL